MVTHLVHIKASEYLFITTVQYLYELIFPTQQIISQLTGAEKKQF